MTFETGFCIFKYFAIFNSRNDFPPPRIFSVLELSVRIDHRRVSWLLLFGSNVVYNSSTLYRTFFKLDATEFVIMCHIAVFNVRVIFFLSFAKRIRVSRPFWHSAYVRVLISSFFVPGTFIFRKKSFSRSPRFLLSLITLRIVERLVQLLLLLLFGLYSVSFERRVDVFSLSIIRAGSVFTWRYKKNKPPQFRYPSIRRVFK